MLSFIFAGLSERGGRHVGEWIVTVDVDVIDGYVFDFLGYTPTYVVENTGGQVMNGVSRFNGSIDS